MAVTQHSTLPSRRGESDAQNYKQRVRRQITEYLKKKIGGEDIITGEGKVKVPVKGTKRYRFILDRGQGGGAGGSNGPGGLEPGDEEYEVWLDMEEIEEMLFSDLDLPRLKPKREVDAEVQDIRWDTFAKQGPQVDKKATLRQNILRNSTKGEVKIGDFERDDLRYVSYHEKPKPRSKAVVFLMMDVSGSMGEYHKRVARLFFYWVVKFLRFRYDTVEVRFIAHTTEAKEVTENQFFNRIESGGTLVSSAYKLAQEMIDERYPTNDWNIYVLHASDGDNWQMDNKDVFSAIKDLCQVCSLVGYTEIQEPQRRAWGVAYNWSTLIDDLGPKRKELGENFMLTHIGSEKDIWGAIKHFFAKEDVEKSVRV